MAVVRVIVVLALVPVTAKYLGKLLATVICGSLGRRSDSSRMGSPLCLNWIRVRSAFRKLNHYLLPHPPTLPRLRLSQARNLAQADQG